MKTIILIFAAAVLSASAATTHIQWVLKLNDGVTPMAGDIYITGPSGSTDTPSTPHPVHIGTGGVVDFYLVGCQGCSYTAEYQLKDARGIRMATWQEKWFVPDTTTVLTIPQIQGGFSAPYYKINKEQMNPAGLAPGEFWNWDGTRWVAVSAGGTWGGGGGAPTGAPAVHAFSHSAGAADQITPASIGAAPLANPAFTGTVSVGPTVLGVPPRFAAATTAVFEGDSLTSGAGLAKSSHNTPACRTSLADATCLDWPSQLLLMSAMSHVTSKNIFAVAGNTIAQIQARYTASVHPLAPAVTGVPAVLFIAAGTNEEYSAGSAASMMAALSAYWAGAKADGFSVVAFTVPPAESFMNNSVAGPKRVALNDLIRAQAGLNYDRLVDTDRLLGNPSNATFYQGDQLHTTAAGHYAEARAVNSMLWGDGLQTPITETGAANSPSGPLMLDTEGNASIPAGSLTVANPGSGQGIYVSQSNGSEVIGAVQTGAGIGLYGSATSGQGVYGTATTGNGVSAFNASGSNAPLFVKNTVGMAVANLNSGANQCVVSIGSGSPEASVTGSPCDLYFNAAGGASTTFWVKETGVLTTTGWVGK